MDNLDKMLKALKEHFGDDWPIVRDKLCDILVAFGDSPLGWDTNEFWNAAQLAKLMADLDQPPLLAETGPYNAW